MIMHRILIVEIVTKVILKMAMKIILGIVLWFDVVAGQCYYTATCSTVYDKGMSYRGPVNSTVTGRACINWHHHVHAVTPERYPYDGLERNFCRNPRGSKNGPWCYTSPETETDGSKIWDYCPVRKCDPCLFRGVHMKEGDRFHHGCSLCFCQKEGIRCLQCSQSRMTDKMGCYMKTDWAASFPKCCPIEVCYGNRAFVFEEYFNYLRTYLPRIQQATPQSHQNVPVHQPNTTMHH